MRGLLILITGLILIVPQLSASGSAPKKTLDAAYDKAIKAGLSPLTAKTRPRNDTEHTSPTRPA